MSKSSRKEYLAKMRSRYAGRGPEGKSRLLDEVCEVCGYGRKYAIRLMNRQQEPERRKAGRKPVYAKEVTAVIKAVWLSSEQPCGKRLRELLPLWLPHYEKHHGPLSAAVRRSAGKASAATLDRLLSPYRSAHPRRCRMPKPGTLLKSEVPIRTDNSDITGPGWVEIDSVAHCGGSLSGDFVWSVNMTDLVSQWTETRAVWNKGQHGVVTAIAGMEQSLPFMLHGMDADNGSEFMHWHLLTYLRERTERPPVALTRSRPYHKNDNAHIEQKNWTHVRQLLGYDRLGHPGCVAALNAVYADWNLLQNFFCPTMKLKTKVREGSKYRKTYHRAETPAERLLGWRGLSKEKRAWIKEQQRQLDPFALHKRVEQGLRRVWQLARQAQPEAAAEQPPALKIAGNQQGAGGRFEAVAPSVTGSLRSPSTAGSTAPKRSAS